MSRIIRALVPAAEVSEFLALNLDTGRLFWKPRSVEP